MQAGPGALCSIWLQLRSGLRRGTRFRRRSSLVPSILQSSTGPSLTPDAVAKTVAELEPAGWRRPPARIEQLMRRLMHYDGGFRREEATSSVGSNATH